MIRRPWFAFAAGAVWLVSGAGCIVTQSSYDSKAREADSLRDALASTNREKTRLADENALLVREVASAKEAQADLSARLKEKDETARTVSEELAAERQKYEGRRVSREQFINELLESEKATGKRLQELSARAEGCEGDLERMKREEAAREQEVSDLRKKLEEAYPDSEATRRERDILAGRVERLQEEHREAGKRREELFARLSEGLGKLSPQVSVFPMGPALRVVVPEKLVANEPGGGLTRMGSVLVSRIAGTAAEIPSASLVVITGRKSSAEALRMAAAKGKIPEERLYAHVRARERQAELLLIAP